jgi:peptidoglycan/LPS O-acetylase OafA/YrhL
MKDVLLKILAYLLPFRLVLVNAGLNSVQWWHLNLIRWRPLTLTGDKYDLQALAGHRFVTLDAMRGVAAISVMFFHYLFGTSHHIFQHGVYAVDFFFVLSGIVLTHSYGFKICNDMTFFDFVKIRMIRLYPFIIIGSVLGTIVFVLYAVWNVVPEFGPIDYASSILSGIVILPYPNHRAVPFVGDRTIGATLFPINIPEWSLFFEILASIMLFLVIKKRIKSQYIFTAAFIMLIFCLLRYKSLNLGVGISTMLGGFPRTAFAFFSGVMMYQLFVGLKGRKVVIHPCIVLAATLIVFVLPPAANQTTRFILGSVLFIVLLPCLIFVALWNDDNSKMYRVFVWLGRISYGIYAIHWPIYHMIAVILNRTAWAGEIKDAPLVLACVVAALVILLAHLLTSVIDEPIRRWLSSGGNRALSASH